MSGAPELRHAALERATSLRDGRVAEVLRRAVLDAQERAGLGWESSDGRVRAVDVLVLVDGYALGLVETWPAVRDGVVEVVAACGPSVLGASVIDLHFEWGLTERPVEPGYRDDAVRHADPRDPEDLRRAIAAFVLAAGDEPLARAVSAAEVTVQGSEIRVRGPEIPPGALDVPLRLLRAHVAAR